jgi:NAD(P)-dependent dehydrogenase (short-subunit alcohol dehydrogenase family)
LASENRVAVVTGAARGIGRKVAMTLAGRGYTVAANDLKAPEETLEELKGIGADTLSLPGDVSDEGAVRGMVEVVIDNLGRVDVLVNNAGVSLISPAEETTLADWQRLLKVNLTGPFLMCREFGKVMLDQGDGSIVNVSSVAGLHSRGIHNRSRYRREGD